MASTGVVTRFRYAQTRAIGEKYKIHDQSKLYFITFATVEWIDVLTRPLYKDIIVESLKFCQKEKGLELYAWCVMSNHMHMIVGIPPMARKLFPCLLTFHRFGFKSTHGTKASVHSP